MLVPAVLSLVFLVIFRSPFALIIGILGPMMALGHWWEGKRQARRESALDWESYELEREQYQRHLQQQAEETKKSLSVRFPAPGEWPLHPLWRPQVESGVATIRLGRGVTQGPAGEPLVGVPVTLTLSHTVGVVGASAAAEKAFLALALGLIACEPALTHQLPRPHAYRQLATGGRLVEVAGFAVHWVDSADQLSPHCADVIVVNSADQASLYRGGVLVNQSFRPDQVTPALFLALIDELAKNTPSEAHETAPPSADPAHLVAWLNPTEWLDLVDDGPHAVVWGQTGSGKTVLLTTLLTSLASAYTPAQVHFVVIDFKGGVGLSALKNLPHLVGTLTDLQPGQARRARLAIQAELVRREQLLADSALSAIHELPVATRPPRTLIVIDEVHTLLQLQPEWVSLLTDIASRGRALGLHLIVAGQRVVGQVPPAILANAPLRICLRVSHPSEATDFLPGVSPTTLVSLSAAAPGELIATRSGKPPLHTVVEPDRSAVAQLGQAGPLWLPDLDETGEATPDNPGTEGALALLDDVETVTRVPLAPDSLGTGLTWVAGDPKSGHTTLLHRLSELADPSATGWLPNRPELLIDSLRQAVGYGHALFPEAPVTVLADRVDQALRGVDPDTIQWAVDALFQLGESLSDRDKPGRLVVTTLAEGDVSRMLSRRLTPHIVLPVKRIDSWNHWGIDPVLWRVSAGPGRIVTRGMAGRVVPPATKADARELWQPRTLTLSGDHRWLVVYASTPVNDAAATLSQLSLAEATERWAEVDQAFRHGTLLLAELGSAAVRTLVRTSMSLPPARSPYLWRVGAAGSELVTLTD